MTTSSHRSRGLPFLHRNWLQATNHWESKMGNKLLSQSHDPSDRLPKDDSQTQRTAKRRRIDNGYDGFPLFEGYGTAQRALRIELLKISHKDSPRLKNGILNGVIAPNVRDVSYVKARCKLTICGFRGGEPVVLHVDSQVCGLRIFKHPPGSAPVARFSSIRPFHIPEEKIFLERDDDAVFGLANTYSVLLELESAGDVNWPPADLVPVSDEEKFYNRGLPPRHWALTASISDIFNNRNRKSIRIRVKKHKHLVNDVDVPTNFLIDLDVRWLTALSQRARGREPIKDIQPSISVFDPHELATPFASGNGPVVNTVSGQQQVGAQTNVTSEGGLVLNGQLNGSGLDLSEEFAEGELTPSRSRRTRQDINYNVKQMWNNAVGKETRKRRKLGEEHSQVDEHTVTYLLPPEQVQTERFACLLCGAENDRLSQLRAHYLSHPQYDFHFEFRPKAGYCVTVKPNANSFGSPLRPKIYQLGLPVKPLDLEKYVNGDDSWVTSRLGPDNGREVFQDNAPQGGRSKSTIKRTQRKVLVPKTKQPLFDPLSKVQLPAGTAIPQRPLDDSWLLLKHRDNLQDFIDLNAAEKEYLQEWDAFIMRQHLSSQEYLPRHFLRFVREHAAWLVEVRSRADEFSKHAATLLTRRMLPDTVIFEATQLVNDARNRRAVMPGALDAASNMSSKERGTAQALLPAPATARNKASGGCCAKCAEPVPMGSLLVCSNKACKKRVYHKHCVADPDAATKAKRRWKCATCS